MDNLLALAILHSGGFTHRDLKKIFETHTNYSEVLEIIVSDGNFLTPWITTERREKIQNRIKTIDTSKIESRIREKNIHIITLESELYPEKLKTIAQSPYLLYVRWDLRECRKMLAIVGSRKSTSYGKKILENIIPTLIKADCGIVSGGAHGIDAYAHEITLEQEGYTISVFGSGIDIYYPSTHTALFDTIIQKGWALLSIFPIGTKPEPYYFPIRNEIVAALSDGIIIPEAGIKSGTLITANLALEHGRDVFAVPGDIFREASMGTNTLIAKWEAKCIQSAQDILEEYFPQHITQPTSLFDEKNWDNDEEKYIFNAILDWYNTPDSIWEKTNYSIDTIILTLSLLEINDHIRLGSGWKYETI